MGTLRLRSHVCLHLHAGAVLLSSLNLTVESRDNPDIEEARFVRRFGLNQDGLDIDSCRNVHVSDCHINSGDDAVCLKSRSGTVCENVTVTNCTLSSNASGIKLGTESNGGFRNVSISNCTIHDIRMAGISISEVDGGVCENIVVSNIVMNNVKGAAVFVHLNGRGRPLEREGEKPAVGALRNVLLSNIIATRIGGVTGNDTEDFRRIGCSITGIPGHPVRGITVRDCRFHFIGGGSVDTCLDPVPETIDVYPNPRMFGGDLPAYGLYCRHVEDLRLCALDLHVDEPDTRPAIVLDDVRGARIEGLCTGHREGQEPVRLINTADVAIILGSESPFPIASDRGRHDRPRRVMIIHYPAPGRECSIRP